MRRIINQFDWLDQSPRSNLIKIDVKDGIGLNNLAYQLLQVFPIMSRLFISSFPFIDGCRI